MLTYVQKNWQVLTLGEIWVYISVVDCFPRILEYLEAPLIKLQHYKKKEKKPSFDIALAFVSIFSPQINSVCVHMITVCMYVCHHMYVWKPELSQQLSIFGDRASH